LQGLVVVVVVMWPSTKPIDPPPFDPHLVEPAVPMELHVENVIQEAVKRMSREHPEDYKGSNQHQMHGPLARHPNGLPVPVTTWCSYSMACTAPAVCGTVACSSRVRSSPR
jgi:hypothetical protein